jgi:hypothetical protein
MRALANFNLKSFLRIMYWSTRGAGLLEIDKRMPRKPFLHLAIVLATAVVAVSCERQPVKHPAGLTPAKLRQMQPFQATITKIETHTTKSGSQFIVIRLAKDDGSQFLFQDTNASPQFVSNVFALNLKTNHTFPDVLFPQTQGDTPQ